MNEESYFGKSSYRATETSEITEMMQPIISAKDPLGNRYRTQYVIEPVRSGQQKTNQNKNLPQTKTATTARQEVSLKYQPPKKLTVKPKSARPSFIKNADGEMIGKMTPSKDVID